MSMNEPPDPTSDGGYLRVGEPHEIWFETRGHGGIPILFLHGGPGGGVRASDRALFDAYSGRTVFHDQRGAGRSRPTMCLEHNTTWDLVADIETLREHLGIERWIVFGGSWGSTLALTYAISHPDVVMALVVHGVFLCREQELRWFYGADGAASLFPDEYANFLAAVDVTESDDVLSAYHDVLSGDDAQRRVDAAQAWGRWEAINSFLAPTDTEIADFTALDNVCAMALLETTYFSNGAWLEENFILKSAAAIEDISCHIVQGRYDTICPVRSAWELHRALPRSKLDIVTLAAHDSTEQMLRLQLEAAIADIVADLS